MKGSLFKDVNGNVSSKRIFGATGLVTYGATSIALAVISVKTGVDVGASAAGLLSTMAVVSGSLLGIGVVENFSQGGKK